MTAREADNRANGYRGPGLAVLERHGVGVWSDVEVETERGRFRGLVLPRSETADDRHVVLKLASGYNVGLAAPTIRSMREHGKRVANYKIPEQEFPTDPGKPDVVLFGTGGTIASRLDYRTGAVIPAFSPGELYGSVPELADICNLRDREALRRPLGEHGAAAVRDAGGALRRGDRGRGRRRRDRPRHRHDAPHGGGPDLHAPGHAGADRSRGLAALQRPAELRRGAVPDQRGQGRGGERHRRGHRLHVRPDLRPVLPAAPGHPRPQDALQLPLDLPHDR